MNTMAIQNFKTKPRQTINLPMTARGRALRTVSWFLNGIEPTQNLDAASIRIKEVNHVYA